MERLTIYREVRCAHSTFWLARKVSGLLARLICSCHVPRDEQQTPRHIGRLCEAQLQAEAGLPLRARGPARSPRLARRNHGARLGELQLGRSGHEVKVPEMRGQAGAHRAGVGRLAPVYLPTFQVGVRASLGLRSGMAHSLPHQHGWDFHAV